MLKFFSCVLMLLLIKLSFAQEISASQKAPNRIDPGSDYIAEITITKGSNNGYIKFSQRMPKGFSASENDSKNGAFSFKDSVVEIVWIVPPVANQFTISYKVSVSKDAKGIKKVKGKITYFFNIHHQFFYLEPHLIIIGTDSVASLDTMRLADSSSISIIRPNQVVPQMNPSDSITFSEKIASIKTESSAISKDSSHQESNDSTKNVMTFAIPLEEQNSGTFQSTTPDTSVKKEIQAATVVDTVKETKRMSTSIFSVTDTTIKGAVIKPSSPLKNSIKDTIAGIIDQKIFPEKTENKTQTALKTKSNSDMALGTDSLVTDKTYRVQIGVFKMKPKIQGIPEISKVVLENGLTKYFSGNFSSMEAALKRKKELIEKGFPDVFIVSFESGKMLK